MPTNSSQISLIITIVMIAISLYAYTEYFNSEVSYVQSTIDQSEYLVRNMPNKEEAADVLALLHRKLRQFVKDILSQYPNDERIQRLHERFQDTKLSESSPDSSFTSYTVNKGSKVVMCVRQRDDHENLVDMNTLTFVSLHELAHIMTKSRGHKPEFWDNFNFLLKHGIKKGFYSYQPYHVRPQKYCGTLISDTPLKI